MAPETLDSDYEKHLNNQYFSLAQPYFPYACGSLKDPSLVLNFVSPGLPLVIAWIFFPV
jgi:hypothetical protein